MPSLFPMDTNNQVLIPSRPASHWPVGMRLRFKMNADLKPGFHHLRGTPVIILSALELVGPSNSPTPYSWRQEILAFSAGCKLGWARPDQLELPVDGNDPEPAYAAQKQPDAARGDHRA